MRSEWGISYIIISYLIAFVCLVFGGLCQNLPPKVCWQWPTLIGSPFCALDVRRLTLIFYISDGQHWDVHKDVQYVSEHSFTMHLIVSNIFIAHLKKNQHQPTLTRSSYMHILTFWTFQDGGALQVCMSDPRRAPASTAEAGSIS